MFVLTFFLSVTITSILRMVAVKASEANKADITCKYKTNSHLFPPTVPLTFTARGLCSSIYMDFD